MKVEWSRYFRGDRKGQIFGAKIWGDNREYPIAVLYFGNGATDSHSFIKVEAVRALGLIRRPQRTCYTCTEPGSHNLAYGPVDQVIYSKAPVFEGEKVSLPTFSLSEMRDIIEKEFGLEAPPFEAADIGQE